MAAGKKRLQRVRPKHPTFIDVFAGCGGLSLGLLQAGWKGLFAIEQDPNAFATLRENLAAPKSRFRYCWPRWLPKQPSSLENFLQINLKELRKLKGKVDLVAGGPPCQGFSTAGRRDPNDPRNKLIKAYLDLVIFLKPKLVLLENVRGITADFRDEAKGSRINYASVLEEALSGHYRFSSQIVDLSSFGVPQKRQRFFVIAIRKDILTYEEDPFVHVEKIRRTFLKEKGINVVPVSARSAISDLEVKRNGKQPSRDSHGFEEILYGTPRTSYQRRMNAGCKEGPTDTRLAKHSDKITRRFQQIITLCHADGRLNTSLSPELRASFGLKKSAIRVLDPERPSPTITSMPDDLIHYSEPRALTVRENARLQSFPDWFSFKGKYTTGGERRRKEVPRFTQVANAVPPLAAEAIGRALLSYTKLGI